MVKKKAEEYKSVTERATDQQLPDWQLLSICRSTEWTVDKQVTKAEFNEALTSFENRTMGG